MSIILEGPDLSGKSTIGERIGDMIGTLPFHFGGPVKTKEAFEHRLKTAKLTMFYDRHPAISEQVYGTIGDRTPLIPAEELTQMLIDLDPLVVYCDPGLPFLLTQLKHLKSKPHKNQDHVDQVRENYTKIYYKYSELMESLSKTIRVRKVNFLTVTHDELKGLINEYFRR